MYSKSAVGNLVLSFARNNMNQNNDDLNDSNNNNIKVDEKKTYLDDSSDFKQQKFPKTVSLMFKSALEEMIKKNRVENFDDEQDYNEIKKNYSKENPFTDHKFKTSNESVIFSNHFKEWLQHEGKLKNSQEIVWKRAKDISRDAQFAVDDYGLHIRADKLNESNYRNYFHTTDLDQGCLGNCWFISAATGIIQNYTLFKRVVPFDNTFENDSYTGAFHFRFWIFGTWKDVVIDDYLPVGPDNRLIFCKNKENSNEFWCALLEKAYAKICGSYEALEGGFTSDALIDMSGGVEESYALNDIRSTLGSSSAKSSNNNKSNASTVDSKTFWEILDNAERKCSVIGCNIDSKDTSISSNGSFHAELRLPNGLVQGHAYIVTKIQKIETKKDVYHLLRLYNPWGNDVEWLGDWSDKSPKWALVDEETRKKLDVRDKKDGEFWMSYEDWLNNFDHCQICNLTPETVCDISENDWENQRLISSIFSLWQCQYFNGKWTKGISAGGRGETDLKKFWTNPQYGFVLTESDMIRDNSCWVIIALMQKHTRNKKRLKTKTPSSEEYIQYRLFKAKSVDIFSEHIKNGKPLENIHLQRINSSGAYINKREVTRRFSLEPGAYIIIPSTFDEDVDGEFLVRVFTEKPINYRNFDETQVDESESSEQTAFSEHVKIEPKDVIANLLHFTGDFRKRNLENEEINEPEEVKFRSDKNSDENFNRRKSVIARRSNLCKQM